MCIDIAKLGSGDLSLKRAATWACLMRGDLSGCSAGKVRATCVLFLGDLPVACCSRAFVFRSVQVQEGFAYGLPTALAAARAAEKVGHALAPSSAALSS